MIRRLALAAGTAVVAAAMAVTGLSTGTAAAAPTPSAGCADYHWLGAAGSGQRDAAGLMSNGGMGGVVYQSYLQLSQQLAASGRTITAEAVQYPAAPVPLEGGIGGWMGFLDSVKAGAAATAKQFEAYTEQCPNSMVVLAGYSQGAMVVHRNLYDLAENPNIAAVLLIADGDRLPVDTTYPLGTTAVTPGIGMGVAQDHSFLAGTNTSKLPASIGSRTISVCDVGDPVCDYDSKSDDSMSPAALAIHTSYVPTTSGVHAWGAPLYQLVARAAPAATVHGSNPAATLATAAG